LPLLLSQFDCFKVEKQFNLGENEIMNNEEIMNQNGRSLYYLIAGGAIGAGLALLFAPKSGKALRQDITDATLKGVEQAKDLSAELSDKAANLSQQAKDVYAQTQEKAVEIYNVAKDGISSAIETAKTDAASVAEDVKTLPEKAENYVADKIENIADKSQDFTNLADRQAKKMRA
jgi:gas vesicle protein